MNNLDAIYDFILKELRKLTIKENFISNQLNQNYLI